MLESRLLRWREVSSLLVYALSLIILLFSHFTFYSLTIIIFLSSLFSISLSFLCFLPLLLVVVYCAWLRPFYTAYHDKIYHFTPQLLLACYGCHSQTTHWSASYTATTNTLCWLRHIPFLNKGSFVFIFLLFMAFSSG